MCYKEELVLTEEEELRARCQKTHIHLLWVVCPWAGLFTSLCLSFCIGTMGLVAPESGGAIGKKIDLKVLHRD